MDTAGIIAQIDVEIGRLQQARALLGEVGRDAEANAKRGRPKGSVNKLATSTKVPNATKRTLSPEGRKAIAMR